MDMDDDMRNRERIQKMIAALQEQGMTENDIDEFLDGSSEEETENLPKKESLAEGEKIQFKLTPNLPAPILTTASAPVLPKKISFLDDPTPSNETPKPEEKPKQPNESNDLKRRYSESIINDQNNPKKIRKTAPSQLSALEELTTSFKKKQTLREEIESKKKAALEKKRKGKRNRTSYRSR